VVVGCAADVLSPAQIRPRSARGAASVRASAKGAYKDRAGRAFLIVTTTVVSRLHLPVNGSLDISMSLLQRFVNVTYHYGSDGTKRCTAGRRINRQQTNRWIPYTQENTLSCTEPSVSSGASTLALLVI
jgi:hypothetical protein